MTSRRQMEKELAITRKLHERSNAEVDRRRAAHYAASDVLESLGYEEHEREERYTQRGEERVRHVFAWTRIPDLVAAENEKAELEAAQRAADLEAAKEAGRLEALQSVIEAFELSQYGYRNPAGYYMSLLVDGLGGPQRFAADINTTLKARKDAHGRSAEKAAIDRVRLANAARVAGGPIVTDPIDANVIIDGAIVAQHLSANRIDATDILAAKPKKPKKKGKNAA